VDGVDMAATEVTEVVMVEVVMEEGDIAATMIGTVDLSSYSVLCFHSVLSV